MKIPVTLNAVQGIPDSETWLLANINQTGFYRVNYDVTNWNMLTQQLLTDHTVFPPENRAQMMDDSLQLARYRPF